MGEDISVSYEPECCHDDTHTTTNHWVQSETPRDWGETWTGKDNSLARGGKRRLFLIDVRRWMISRVIVGICYHPECFETWSELISNTFFSSWFLVTISCKLQDLLSARCPRTNWSAQRSLFSTSMETNVSWKHQQIADIWYGFPTT